MRLKSLCDFEKHLLKLSRVAFKIGYDAGVSFYEKYPSELLGEKNKSDLEKEGKKAIAEISLLSFHKLVTELKRAAESRFSEIIRTENIEKMLYDAMYVGVRVAREDMLRKLNRKKRKLLDIIFNL